MKQTMHVPMVSRAANSLTRSFRFRLLVLAALVAVVLGAIPGVAAAATFEGATSMRWATLSSYTTKILVREHYGTDVDPSDAPRYTTFLASNSKTAFYDTLVDSNGMATGRRRLSRSAFFRHIKAKRHDLVTVHWSWRTNSSGSRYRYVYRLVVSDAAGG